MPAHAASATVGVPPPALRPHRFAAEAEVGRHDEDDDDERRPHDDQHGEDRSHGELAHLGEGALPRLGLGGAVQLLAGCALPDKDGNSLNTCQII